MEINKEIIEILKEFKINKDAGILVLLGIYYKLDVDEVCPEEVIKSINTTKIIEKDYRTHLIKWNIPLFEGQQTEWDWVRRWNDAYGKLAPSRKGAQNVVLQRMQAFFAKYPQYRQEDVSKALRMYMDSEDPKYYKNSAALIFDGAGAMKNSILLAWCEKAKAISGPDTSQQRGKVMK